MPKQIYKLIIITGTPGTGKSTIAAWLSKKLNWKHINLHNYYKQISTNYDRSARCYDIDLKKLEELIIQLKNENIILDTHISHHLPKKIVDLCIITECNNIKKLKNRLTKRKYSKQKIKENLQAELLHICLDEAIENNHKPIIIDTSKRYNKTEFLTKIKTALKL